jgi:hypothetical protein
MREHDIINEEFDNIMELIANNSLEIQKFEIYAPLLKSLTHKNRYKWNEPRTCIYPTCSSLSVKKSHSIAKSNSLKVIANKGHVLQPSVDVFAKNLEVSMKPVGINNASTFPGFCEKHEKLFHKFEHEKIHEDSFVMLQTYRAICREVVCLNIEVEIIQNKIDIYKEKIEQESLAILLDRLRDRGVKGPKNLNIKGIDKILTQLEGMKNDFNTRIAYLKKHSEQILDDFESNSVGKKRKTINHGVCIDHKFPVSLCGYTSIAYGSKSIKKMLLIANIIPMENCTYIFCSTDKRHNKFFNNITEYYFQSALTSLIFIETFMVHSSDHWFMNPPYWDSLSKEKQEMILSEILNVNKLITDEFEYSIFDDIRSTILLEYEKHADSFLNADRVLFEKEKNKLFIISEYKPQSEDQRIDMIKKYWLKRLS